MKLVIDNRTGYLNDYYFQTLCLLYFPGEKFPASPAPDAPEAVVGFTARRTASPAPCACA